MFIFVARAGYSLFLQNSELELEINYEEAEKRRLLRALDF